MLTYMIQIWLTEKYCLWIHGPKRNNSDSLHMFEGAVCIYNINPPAGTVIPCAGLCRL
jgi:hypothetical protein